MKRIIFVGFILLCVASFTKCEETEARVEELEVQEVEVKQIYIRQFFMRHKQRLHDRLESLEDRCPGVNQRVKDLHEPFAQCLDRLDGSLTLCTIAERFLMNCTSMIFKVVDDCLPEASRGLLMFGLKSMYSVVDYLCKSTGETLIELSNSCLWNDLEKHNQTELHKCTEKVLTTAHKFRGQPPNVREVCFEATAFRRCIETRVKHSCKNKITHNAFLGLYDGLIAPCNNIKKV